MSKSEKKGLGIGEYARTTKIHQLPIYSPCLKHAFNDNFEPREKEFSPFGHNLKRGLLTREQRPLVLATVAHEGLD
jgi:hypothetical protein